VGSWLGAILQFVGLAVVLHYGGAFVKGELDCLELFLDVGDAV